MAGRTAPGRRARGSPPQEAWSLRSSSPARGRRGAPMLFEVLQAPLEEFAPAPFFNQKGFDALEGLEDGVVFLFEAFEPPVDVVEVPQDLPELLIVAIQPLFDHIKPLIHEIEPAVHGLESTVDGSELPPQERDQVLVFAVRHVLASRPRSPRIASFHGPAREPKHTRKPFGLARRQAWCSGITSRRGHIR